MLKRTFAGNAESYQKTRPQYPQELLHNLLDFWKQKNNQATQPFIIDVGCGTGIATRNIYAATKPATVVGIDPSLKMLTQAMAATPNESNIYYLEGKAETLPFPSQSVDIALVAQAMHYFDRPKFYFEAKRILKPQGVIAIIENNRNWQQSEFLADYENFLEQFASDTQYQYSRHHREFNFINELKQSFTNTFEKSFHWKREMDLAEFMQLAYSSTQVQHVILNIGKQQTDAKLLALINHYFQKNTVIEMPYVTKLYAARN